MFSNFASEERKRVCGCFVRAEKNDVLLNAVRLEPVPYYSYYEEIPCPQKRAFSLFKVEGFTVCVHRGGDIMYTRTGDYFGKTKFYYDGAH